MSEAKELRATVEVPETAREIAARMYEEAGHCNCDLDNWEPEKSTGHSWVCRIHKAALDAVRAAAEGRG